MSKGGPSQVQKWLLAYLVFNLVKQMQLKSSSVNIIPIVFRHLSSCWSERPELNLIAGNASFSLQVQPSVAHKLLKKRKAWIMRRRLRKLCRVYCRRWSAPWQEVSSCAHGLSIFILEQKSLSSAVDVFSVFNKMLLCIWSWRHHLVWM